MSDESTSTPNVEPTDPKTVTATVPVADPAKAAPASVTPAEVRKFKLKINGAEREVDEKFLLAHAQKGIAADERFQEAAKSRKTMEALVKKAKEDPDALLRELTGRDPEEIYKEKLSEKLRRLTMDPKERELEEYKAKIASFEAEKAARDEADKKAAMDKTTQFFVKKYDKEIPEAIKAAGLPLTEDVIKYTADIMLSNLEEGLDLPYDVVMELVRDRYMRGVKGFLSTADKEKLIDLLGEDVVDALIAAKAKKGKAAGKQPAKQAVSAPEPTKSPYMTPDELKKYVEEWSKQ